MGAGRGFIVFRLARHVHSLQEARLRVRRQIAGWRRQLRRHRLPQIVLIFGFWLVGQKVADWSGLPLPGGVVGMLLVLALLSAGWMRAGILRRGANWYLGEMLLFFIPAVAAVREHPEFLGVLGAKLLVAIVAGTLVVMLATALSVELCYRLIFAAAPGLGTASAANSPGSPTVVEADHDDRG
jgi:holin-like protein